MRYIIPHEAQSSSLIWQPSNRHELKYHCREQSFPVLDTALEVLPHETLRTILSKEIQVCAHNNSVFGTSCQRKSLYSYIQTSISAHKKKVVECLLCKCSPRVSEVQDIHTQNGDSYKLFGSADQSIKYESQKVALQPELKILQQPQYSVSCILDIRNLNFQRCVLPSNQY